MMKKKDKRKSRRKQNPKRKTMGRIDQQKKVKPYPRNQGGEIQRVDSKEKKIKG